MAMDRWLEVSSVGIFLVEENDGWAYLRKGPEQTRTEVVLTAVDDPGPGEQWGRVHYELVSRRGSSGFLGIPAKACGEYRRWLNPGQGDAER
jgi:hypothetical protein